MTRPRVLLAGPIDPSGERIIATRADIVAAPDVRPETLRRLVADADVLVVRAQLPADVFDHAPRLRGVVRHGVGLDMIPMEAASAHGIPVANVPGSNRDAVAEHVLTCFGLLTRHTQRMDRSLHESGWGASRKLAERATELNGQTVGIVGVGSIGLRIAEICHFGYRMTVLGHQRRLDALPAFIEGAALDDLLARSDFVVLSCPLNAATQGLIDARRLALMKPGAFLVNVARGAVIIEAALIAALRGGRLASAALDVFETQPLTPQHPLLALDNVLLTPHVAGLTAQSMARMSQGTAEEVLRLLAGDRPVNLVNPEVWERRRR
ncbi:hydroxyacid dehydrogenase [Methylibium sp.]|uniref:hydroxyacid dehydrogenase n=1 Tax=Methylibium sp. TaxID=2067992 RepID=UPI0025D1EE6C|nr:hydroxyacid dehydrogenase [Methylibium sp.]